MCNMNAYADIANDYIARDDAPARNAVRHLITVLVDDVILDPACTPARDVTITNPASVNVCDDMYLHLFAVRVASDMGTEVVCLGVATNGDGTYDFIRRPEEDPILGTLVARAQEYDFGF